jgi:Zn-dependent M28 family amino/carboxypeptidase
MLNRLTAAAVVLFASAAAPAADPVVARMTKDIFYLAGPECEGRGIETEGIKKAGEYIANTFKEAGLKPAMKDGSYFQPFEIAGPTRLGTPNTLEFKAGDQTVDLKYGTDFTTTGMSGSGKKAAGLVFVGYGISAPGLKYDDYADVDVSGKFVIVLRRTPRAEDKEKPFDADPNSPHPALATKLQLAARKGAAGVIFANDATYGKTGDALMGFDYRGAPPAGMPVLHVKRAALEKLLAAAGKKLSDVEAAINEENKPHTFELKDWTATAETTISKVGYPTRNVVGVAEGAGPLADETIVIGAHYDHLGNGEPGSLLGAAGKGKTHWGADDNGSGTCGVLELARRFGAMKNRVGRRVVFVTFSGEERGLFGSIHYCKEPPFPLEKTVFMLNMDMIGRVIPVPEDEMFEKAVGVAAAAGATGPVVSALRDRVVVYGTGTAAGMDELVTSANKPFDFKLMKVPGGTGPSDHDSFYRKKVPVLFFFTGLHRDYHRPTDTPDKINVPGMKKVADYAEVLALHFTAATERPKYLVTTGGWEDPTEERPARPQPKRAAAPKLGIMPGNYEAQDGGVLVDDVSPGGAAEKGGVKAQDIIVEIAGKPVKNIESYMAVMAGQKADREIEIVVLRKDKKVMLKVTPKP